MTRALQRVSTSVAIRAQTAAHGVLLVAPHIAAGVELRIAVSRRPWPLIGAELGPTRRRRRRRRRRRHAREVEREQQEKKGGLDLGGVVEEEGEGEPRVAFEVVGRNPVVVRSRGGGGREAGELRDGDGVALSLRAPSFWSVRRRRRGSKRGDVEAEVLDAVERRERHTRERKERERRAAEEAMEVIFLKFVKNTIFFIICQKYRDDKLG
uniref:Uncharacterized protein n=1 Tax=Oryza brachyantha TaxID=4533 RepID=J3N4J6_ORYBR